jgi:tetratricopeptide (TPR) repeat protein
MPAYERALANAPFNVETMAGAAESLIDLGRRSEAAALLVRAQTLTPFDWRVHYLQGVLAIVEGRLADAIPALHAAAELAPGVNAAIENTLANALYATGSHTEALRSAQRAINVQTHEPAHRLIRGKALFAMGEFAKAREDFAYSAEHFRAALERGEKAAASLNESEEWLAMALIKEGRIPEALAPLGRIEEYSDEAAVRAADRLEPWLIVSGTNAPLEFWIYTIRAFLQADRAPEADRLLNRASELYPDQHGVGLLPYRALNLLSVGQTEEALALLRSAIDSARPFAAYSFALASVHAKLGNDATAALELSSVLNRRDLAPAFRRSAIRTLAQVSTQ